MRTPLCEEFGIEYPIFAFTHCRDVVAAVSKAGGLGVLGAVGFSPEQLEIELDWIDEHIDGKPYGVDTVMPQKAVDVHGATPDELIAQIRGMIPERHRQYVEELIARFELPELPTGDEPHGVIGWAEDVARAHVEIAFAHPIALLANALGPPPAGLVARARQAGIAVAALVGQAKHARRQLDAGVDVLIAQGTEAGGHTGTIATMVLTPEIVDIAGGRPVLAAGGIASGRQMAAALALGAAGVWCGSVWLSSEEDVANQALKAKFLAASSSDTLRSPTRTGKPARQLRTAWHDEWERPGSPGPLPMPLQPMLVNEAWQRIDAAADAGHEGALRLESFFIGQVVGSFDAVRPAAEITRQLAADCEQRIAELGGLL